MGAECSRCGYDVYDECGHCKVIDERDQWEAACAQARDREATLAVENAKLREFVERAAIPRRNDGTYNHSREALEQQARVLLGGRP